MGLRTIAILALGIAEVAILQGADLTNITSFKPFVGLGYSPFIGNQSPNDGTYPTVAQIAYDLTNSVVFLASEIRTYGMDNTLSNIAGICNTCGLRCYPCAYLSTQYPTDNTNELNSLIAVGKENYPTTRGLVVGNEAILQGYDPNTLISNINYVRAVTRTNIPIGTADIPANFLTNPAVVAASDFVMADIYGYWGQISMTNAAAWTIQQWQALTNAFPGKKILIGEANWPTGGTNTMWSNPQVVASVANQARFLADFVSMAKSNNIEYFIFEYRDEPWKIQEGIGTIEQNWGIVDTNSVKKQSLVSCLSTNFSMQLLSAKTNRAQISVRTYEGNRYWLFGAVDVLGPWGNPSINFTAASGTNQTIITVTNNSQQNAEFYKAMEDF